MCVKSSFLACTYRFDFKECFLSIKKQLKINAPAEKVWKVFAHDFDNAHIWMASVANSFGEEVGVQPEGSPTDGRICELNNDPKGFT